MLGFINFCGRVATGESMRELYEKYYFHELNRQANIVTSLQLPTGVITVIVGGLFYMLHSYSFAAGWKNMDYTFLLSLAVSLLLTLTCIYSLIRAASGQAYRYLPDAATLNDYYKELLTYYEYYNNKTNAKGLTDEEFDRYMTAKYMESASDNYFSNAHKSKHRHFAHVFLTWSLVSAIISADVFVAHYFATLQPPPHSFAYESGSVQIEVHWR